MSEFVRSRQQLRLQVTLDQMVVIPRAAASADVMEFVIDANAPWSVSKEQMQHAADILHTAANLGLTHNFLYEQLDKIYDYRKGQARSSSSTEVGVYAEALAEAMVLVRAAAVGHLVI